jgi:hypothetical protein
MDTHINLIITDGKAFIVGVKRDDNKQAMPIYAELEPQDVIELMRSTEKSWADDIQKDFNPLKQSINDLREQVKWDNASHHGDNGSQDMTFPAENVMSAETEE